LQSAFCCAGIIAKRKASDLTSSHFSMSTAILATFVTTTTYGTWLPGDVRWYVEHKQTLPPSPKLHRYAQSLMKQEPVYLHAEQQDAIFGALRDAAAEFNYRLADVSVESWHLHWTIWHGCDMVKVMVGRLKNRMRQKLNIGRIWTHGYCYESLDGELAVENVRQYIAHHSGCRMIDGVIIEKQKLMRAPTPSASTGIQPPGGARG
jgi:hypothetical protein